VTSVLQLLSGFSPGFLSFAASMLPIAAGAVLIDTAMGTRVQLDSAEDIRGRVLAGQGMVAAGTGALGGPLVGWLAETLGPGRALNMAGLVTVVATAVATGALLRLRRRREAASVPSRDASNSPGDAGRGRPLGDGHARRPAGRPRPAAGASGIADSPLRVALDMTSVTEFDPHALLAESRLGVLATIKSDGRPQLSPVTPTFDRNAGIIHVSMTEGRAKTINLRRDPRATLEVTSPDGWSWATAEGIATLTGPGTDPHGPEVRALVDYYRAAAGEHPDWDEYRSVMVSERRVLMTMTVDKVYGARIR